MTGLVVCACAEKLGEEAVQGWRGRLDFAPHAVTRGDLCGKVGIAAAVAWLKEAGPDRVLLAGCPLLASPTFAAALSRETGIPRDSVETVFILPEAGIEERAGAIKAAYDALEMVPSFGTRRVPLGQDVLVVGGAEGAAEAVRALESLGHGAIRLEQASALESMQYAEGGYRARIAGSAGASVRDFGAVILASGVELSGTDRAPFVEGRVVPLEDLQGIVTGLPRVRRTRQVAMLLDLELDEGRQGTVAALRTGLALARLPRTQVAILLREVRVAALGLEALYDEARLAGVSFVKFEGACRIRAQEERVAVECRDAVLGEDVELLCDIAGVSRLGLASPAPRGLADATGVKLDGHGRLQENNIHLLPEKTNRPGVFVVGECRGETYGPSILRDAQVASLSVHRMLQPREIEVKLDHAVVDPEKCALCLTCVRVCPFGAMRIHAEEKRADCIAEICKRCGICSAECPNKAVVLPAHTDALLLMRAGRA